MSFSDLMTSARGPGVIGTILALIVLLGFGLLFMYSFDEGSQGAGKTIESVIRDQHREIESLTVRIGNHAARLDQGKGRKSILDELKKTETQAVRQRAEIEWLEERGTSLDGELAAIGEEFETYKDRYRAHVRKAAEGTKLDRLTTLHGETFENVTIRQVNAVGMQIAHQAGFKRIPFEELPEDMMDLYQFCPAQKEQALAREKEIRNLHETQVAAAKGAVEQKRAEEAVRQEALQREQNARLLQNSLDRIKTLEDEIRQLQRDIADEALKRISRAPQMRQQLAMKEREKARLQAQVNRLRTGL